MSLALQFSFTFSWSLLLRDTFSFILLFQCAQLAAAVTWSVFFAAVFGSEEPPSLVVVVVCSLSLLLYKPNSNLNCLFTLHSERDCRFVCLDTPMCTSTLKVLTGKYKRREGGEALFAVSFSFAMWVLVRIVEWSRTLLLKFSLNFVSSLLNSPATYSWASW